MMKRIFDDCVSMIHAVAGHEIIYFETPVEVRFSPHSPAFHAWAVCASPFNDIYFMGADEQWEKYDDTDLNGDLLLGSLYQRLSLMQWAKAS
jgi:hypothetical protein